MSWPNSVWVIAPLFRLPDGIRTTDTMMIHQIRNPIIGNTRINTLIQPIMLTVVSSSSVSVSPVLTYPAV